MIEAVLYNDLMSIDISLGPNDPRDDLGASRPSNLSRATGSNPTLSVDFDLGSNVSKAARGIMRIVSIPIILFGLIFIAIGTIWLVNNLQSSQKFTSQVDATITRVNSKDVTSTDDDGYTTHSTECSPTYRFTVDSKEYSRRSDSYSDSNCDAQAGQSLSVKYDPKSPSDSVPASDVSGFAVYAPAIFIIVGLVPVIIGSVLLFSARKWHKTADNDGDGLNNDALPATNEQMKLIENGMHDLGQFYAPSKRPTQAEARETLRSIQDQLALSSANQAANPGSSISFDQPQATHVSPVSPSKSAVQSDDTSVVRDANSFTNNERL